MKPQALIDAFEKAGIGLVLLKDPIRGPRHIFQLDIQSTRKGNHREEVIRMYIPDPQVIVQVRDTDLHFHQVLLLVNEPVREFEETIKLSKFRKKADIVEAAKRNRARIVRSNDHEVVVATKTPGTVRYFLMGVDERQLFISQIQNTARPTSVEAARRFLGSTVVFAEGKRRNSTDRQGEWFFLETSNETRNHIDTMIERCRAAVQKKVPIGPAFGRRQGNPHTVDELIVVPRGERDGKKFIRTSGNRIFIRGAVRHRDHKTLKFNHWREVIANNEQTDGVRGANGVYWFD